MLEGPSVVFLDPSLQRWLFSNGMKYMYYGSEGGFWFIFMGKTLPVGSFPDLTDFCVAQQGGCTWGLPLLDNSKAAPSEISREGEDMQRCAVHSGFVSQIFQAGSSDHLLLILYIGLEKVTVFRQFH